MSDQKRMILFAFKLILIKRKYSHADILSQGIHLFFDNVHSIRERAFQYPSLNEKEKDVLALIWFCMNHQVEKIDKIKKNSFYFFYLL